MSHIFWAPGQEALYRKHKEARYPVRVIQCSKQYGVRRAAEKFKVSAGSIAWTHSWEKLEREPNKKVTGGIYMPSGGGWGVHRAVCVLIPSRILATRSERACLANTL